MRKPVFGGLCTTKGQTSLICSFVIDLLEKIISRLATSEISIFKPVSVAEQTDLNLTLSDIPKTGFLAPRPI